MRAEGSRKPPRARPAHCATTAAALPPAAGRRPRARPRAATASWPPLLLQRPPCRCAVLLRQEARLQWPAPPLLRLAPVVAPVLTPMLAPRRLPSPHRTACLRRRLQPRRRCTWPRQSQRTARGRCRRRTQHASVPAAPPSRRRTPPRPTWRRRSLPPPAGGRPPCTGTPGTPTGPATAGHTLSGRRKVMGSAAEVFDSVVCCTQLSSLIQWIQTHWLLSGPTVVGQQLRPGRYAHNTATVQVSMKHRLRRTRFSQSDHVCSCVEAARLNTGWRHVLTAT